MSDWSSPSHQLIILLIVILLSGAKKVPELIKGLDRGTKTFKDEMSNKDEAARNTHKIEEKQDTINHTNTNANIDEAEKS